jgi:hypothetical protein
MFKGWLEKLGGKAQTPRKRKGRKKKKKEMTDGDKSNLLSVHAPHIQWEDTDTKLKPPWKGLFGRWN